MSDALIPPWATLAVSHTERGLLGITYEVRLESESRAFEYDGPEQSQTVWSREVFFGQTDSHCAGGYAFREAAREQDAWAERYAAAIRIGATEVPE